MFKKCLLMVVVSAPMVFAYQTESFFPWLTNNANFKSRVIINNLNDEEVEVILVATRNDGSEEGTIRTIGPLGQLVESTETLFPALGEGPGYVVIALGNAANIDSAFIINSQSGASGSSPAQADVLPPDAAGNHLLFNYLPVETGGGASAPVVVNTGGEDANIVFHAYQDGVEVAVSEPVIVASGRPFAQITSALFPGVVGDIYVVAESNMPLLGMAFIFNEFGEPSMAGAKSIPSLPGSGGEN